MEFAEKEKRDVSAILGKSSLRSRSLRTVISGGSACQDCGGGHWGQTPCCRWRLPWRTPRAVGRVGLAWELESEGALHTCRKRDYGPISPKVAKKKVGNLREAVFSALWDLGPPNIKEFS